MTYAELAEKISKMTKRQRNSDVTVYVLSNDEFYGLIDFDAYGLEQLSFNNVIDDRLDPGHPYLII